MLTDTQRLLLRTAKTEHCWNWLGPKNAKGYGIFKTATQSLAHRASYELFVGEIPAGLMVLHSCDNPRCVNPGHLSLGTGYENAVQKEERGRGNHAFAERNANTKLTLAQAAEVKAMLRAGASQRKVATKFSISRAAVICIRDGRSWKCA